MAKIILLGSYAPSLVNFRGSLLKEFVKQGHEVIAYAPEISPSVKTILEGYGVSYYDVPLSRTGLNPWKDIKTIIALRYLFLKEKPDAVLSYTIKPVLYGSIAAWLGGVSNIYSMITGLGYSFMGNSVKQRIVGKIAQLLYKISTKRNTKVFFQNPDDLSLFIKLDLVQKEQTVLINGSGVDLKHFSIKPLPEAVSFLLIARLIKEKGIQEYAEAARIIRDRYPDTKCTLVGRVDPSPAAINPIDLKNWQQDGLLDFKGRMEDVRPAIANASVYVLPSYREGIPRTVLEAMAMGRPVITTDAPGCRETVIDGLNGYLVPVKAHATLAKAMERFILHPELIQQMGIESRIIAEEKYDVHKVNEVIMREMTLC